MRLLQPLPPPYDIERWRQLPFAERLRLSCQAWALQGYGTPIAVFTVYLLKIALYLGGWCLFCSFSANLGDPRQLSQWWLTPTAFQKAVLWSMLFEGLGLGCGSGPLTGRYHPMIGGVLYFARPGTTKAPLLPGAPIIGDDRRGWLDVGLYLLHVGLLLRALTAESITPALVWPTIVLLMLLGVLDRALFLSARAEHFLAAMVCFAFPDDWLAGSKVVWLSIWFWAAFSKLNRHFPAVIGVMVSNSPWLRWAWLRKRMYNNFPDDLRPSKLAGWMGHCGTAVEFGFPLLLVFAPDTQWLAGGIIAMLLFHAFITGNVPMGVPIEWNIVMVYGAIFLFWEQAAVAPWSVRAWPLIAVLLVVSLAVPLIGNLLPRYVSFLPSMRYYAGNWAYSVWLFADGSERKLDEHLVKSAPLTRTQLARFYDDATIDNIVGKVVAFRAMHLHGRLLQQLLPKTGIDLERCEYMDGEILCGVVLGYNFGDGHLHDERLLAAVQRQCHFAPGELRCIFVESQPLGNPCLHWRIADACDGPLQEGHANVAALTELQPWPSSAGQATVSEAKA